MRNLIGIIVVVWLVIGVAVAFQRGYLTGKDSVSCHSLGDTALTVIAGPIRYAMNANEMKMNQMMSQNDMENLSWRFVARRTRRRRGRSARLRRDPLPIAGTGIRQGRRSRR